MTEKLPIGTKVRYTGSLTAFRGEFEVFSYTDPSYLRAIKGDGVVDKYYPGDIAYVLWPKGLPHKFGERGKGVLYDVRRDSITVIEEFS